MSTISPFREDAEAAGPFESATDLYAEALDEGESWSLAETDQVAADAGPFAEAVPEEEGEFTGPLLAAVTRDPFPSARLKWPGASPRELAFMRAVYDRHRLDSKAKRAFVADLPRSALDVIEGKKRAQADVARAARALLAEARAALAASPHAGRLQIGVVSAYRTVGDQFVRWQKTFPSYYRRAVQQGIVRQGDYGSSAVGGVAQYVGKYVAAPGYSDHQDGLAVDFGSGELGRNLAKIGPGSWFHDWLRANAGRFGFQPYDLEPWHWKYRPGAASEQETAEAWEAGEEEWEEPDWEEAFLAEEESEVPSIPSSGLEWPGASAAELQFMRAVYERHVERSRAAGGTFTADLRQEDLGVIEGSHEARKDAAEAARALLADARTALAADGLAGNVRIGIVSAYRPASRQFIIWQGKGRKGGFPYYYRQMLERGKLRPGDYGPRAVEAMVREIGGWIAAPGYSNHQDGLAIDFGTGAVGRGLGTIGKRAWFHKWLLENAARFGFHPYHKEAWHWTYRGPAQSEAWLGEVGAAGIRAGRLDVAHVPLLARHRGNAPALVLRWNDMPSTPQEVDVVVHLHGYSRRGMKLPRHIEPYSGLDLAPVDGAEGRGRSRPTLTVLPRGHFTGVKQKHGDLYVHTFPALVAKDALPKLVQFSVDRFAAEVGGTAPRVGRLILTAHSGGGQPLMEILKHHDPDEVHVFDALYWDPRPLADWAIRHIRQDRAGTPTGALRVFYGRGTRRFSRRLLDAIAPELGPEVVDRYRVEKSTLGHWQIPRQYGWRVLADAAADVPNAVREPVGQREVFEADFEEGDFEAAPFDEWGESEAFDGLEEMEDLELVAATAAYEALSTALEVSDLDRGRAVRELEEEEEDYELGDATPEYEALSAAFEAADSVGEEAFEEAEEGYELGVETPDYEALSAAFEAADLATESRLSEVEEAEDEESIESGEVELGEAEAFLEDLYSLEPVFEEETRATVTFPSGATLRVASGPTAEGEEHFDPNRTGNALLDTSEPVRSTRLSTSFTVGELARSGGRNFDRARIDPELVRCLQKLRDHVGKPVHVTSGYRPYLYNVDLYKNRDQTPTKSRHSSGQAADVKIAGMTGMDIAKAAIDACGSEIGVGIGADFAHVDVRGKWSYWTYPRDKPPNERWIAEINAYRRQRLGAGPAAAPASPAHDGAPRTGASAQILEALGRGLWDTAVRIAIGTGVTDVNQLTNMLFYLRHPDLRGKRIGPEQRDLAREWIEIRDRWVKPALAALGT